MDHQATASSWISNTSTGKRAHGQTVGALALLEQLKEEIIHGLVLARPDYNRRFYLKTDWSKHGMAAVLCQADPECSESIAAEKTEAAGGPCLFDKAKTGPRLIPLLFMARLCTAREADYVPLL